MRHNERMKSRQRAEAKEGKNMATTTKAAITDFLENGGDDIIMSIWADELVKNRVPDNFKTDETKESCKKFLMLTQNGVDREQAIIDAFFNGDYESFESILFREGEVIVTYQAQLDECYLGNAKKSFC